MHWIDKLNQELKERRDRLSTEEAKYEAYCKNRKYASKHGSKKGGLANVKSGHMAKLNKSFTSERRSELKTKKISLEEILEAQKGETSPGKIAKKLGLSPLTYRKKLKEHGIYKPYVAPKYDCPHCGKKSIDSGNYGKSHGDNCKQK